MLLDTVDRHFYTNNSYERLKQVKEESIDGQDMEPEQTLQYVIKKYDLDV